LAAAVVLVLGLAVFTALVLTASWISGVYGQVGMSGGIIFGLVAALVLPYIIVLPAAELAWVGPRASTRVAVLPPGGPQNENPAVAAKVAAKKDATSTLVSGS